MKTQSLTIHPPSICYGIGVRVRVNNFHSGNISYSIHHQMGISWVDPNPNPTKHKDEFLLLLLLLWLLLMGSILCHLYFSGYLEEKVFTINNPKKTGFILE